MVMDHAGRNRRYYKTGYRFTLNKQFWMAVPKLDHCELENLTFDTYDNGICVAEYLIEYMYIIDVDGQRIEAFSMKKSCLS